MVGRGLAAISFVANVGDQRLATIDEPRCPMVQRVRCIALLCRGHDPRLARPTHHESDHEVQTKAPCQGERQGEDVKSRIGIPHFMKQGERTTHRREHKDEAESQISEPR